MLAETEIEFADCPQELLASYAENGEGVDRAGGGHGHDLCSVMQ